MPTAYTKNLLRDRFGDPAASFDVPQLQQLRQKKQIRTQQNCCSGGHRSVKAGNREDSRTMVGTQRSPDPVFWRQIVGALRLDAHPWARKAADQHRKEVSAEAVRK